MLSKICTAALIAVVGSSIRIEADGETCSYNECQAYGEYADPCPCTCGGNTTTNNWKWDWDWDLGLW